MTPRGFNTALELYRTGTLSLGRAARFAGCTPTELRTAAHGVGDDDPDASQSEGTAERVEAQ